MGASRRVKTALPDRYPRSVVDAFLCFALDLLCFLGSLALTGVRQVANADFYQRVCPSRSDPFDARGDPR